MEHRVKLARLESTFVHVLGQFRLGDVAGIRLAHFGNVFAPQNLITLLVIPSAFLVVGQTIVSFLNQLKLLCGVLVWIFVWMPLQRCFLIRLDVKAILPF